MSFMFQVSLGRFSDRLTVVETVKSVRTVASAECGGQKLVIELLDTKVRMTNRLIGWTIISKQTFIKSPCSLGLVN